ncbi:MAG: DUF1203 domain-containing protein [Actinomycetota bacterium]
MTNTAFAIRPIPAEEAAILRRVGGEVYVADSMPGYPCRQCLRDAEIGEELILVSYTPFSSESPYRSASPIFLHKEDCGGPAEIGDGLPLQLARRRLAVRSFDDREMMLDAAVIDGKNLAETADAFLADDDAQRIEVYNADRGCWAATVARARGLRSWGVCRLAVAAAGGAGGAVVRPVPT